MFNPSTQLQVHATFDQPNRASFIQIHSQDEDAVRKEVIAGLTASSPALSPKFLYDKLGSTLFSAITQVPEYYPSRCEVEIIQRHAAEIARHLGLVRTIIDLGAGDCGKAERLFPLLMPEQYVPIDISSDYLKEAVARIGERYQDLDIVAIGMDFFGGLDLPPVVDNKNRLFFYPGSSIGNLTPGHACALLESVRNQCVDGALLIGVDLMKARDVLELAYDDELGVTAAFNLNVLRHTNQIIGADFRVRDWRHVAFFNDSQSRIEMHLQAAKDMTVAWPGGQRTFRPGDQIHTESSYKYAPEAFEGMLRSAGFGDIRYWTDEREWFALFAAHAVTEQ
jgi:dimethylhistidine N-methyltransferase